MIPAKIEDVFIQITTDKSGEILNIDAGKFAKKEFKLQESIYVTCPFLEGVLNAIPLKESFLIEGMIIVSESVEYNIDVELFKSDKDISVLIHNRTNVYAFVKQLNQNRNDIFFIKREIAEKNKELEKLRKIADKANAEKSRFLAMMSHEIRNPLNAILGYSEIIAEEEINDTIKESIFFLSSAGKNLKVIVDDILDLSRIEAGKLELISEEISIKEIIEICKNNFKHQQKNKDVDLLFSISEKVPKYASGDSVRITQVLSNLISNSIKFTTKGTIKILVETVSETKKNTVINFKVADTGRGMTTEQVSKIFEEYQQVKVNDNRIHGGAGLGLTIVERLVYAMNGTISVESKINKGTTFSVEIPFDKVEKTKHVLDLKTTISNKITLEGKKILVADDDILNQTIVSHILNKEKAIITIVNDGSEALSKINSESFDVILLDINMPNMTGEELVKQKNTFSKYNLETPFLALTGNTSKEDIERYLEIGFLRVISKPYTSTEFVDKIKTAF